MYPYCEKIKQQINQIASGDIGYLPKSIEAVLKFLDKVADDESLPEKMRNEAAYVAANLVLSDHED